MNIQPIIINFKSNQEVENQAYQVILKTINDAFLAAQGNLELMQNLNQLAKELRYATEHAIDRLENGVVVKREPTLPEVA